MSPSAFPETVTVTIPDLFKSFLKDELRMNPCYEEVKNESEQYVIEYKVISYESTFNKCPLN
jgi:hypothetical protein